MTHSVLTSITRLAFSTPTRELDIFSRPKESIDLFTDMIEEGEDIEPTGAGSVKETMVSEVWREPGDRMVMLFDYGDDWRFTVVLKAWGVQDKTRKYPVILEKKGRAPKQYA